MPRTLDLLAVRTGRFEALRYVAVAGFLAASCGGALLAFGGPAPDEPSPEVDNAVLVDLPAADAAARPPSEATDGPEQQASPAAAAAPAAPTVKPVRPQEKQAQTAASAQPLDASPTPPGDPATNQQEVKRPVAPPLMAPPTAPAPAQMETATSGAEVPGVKRDDDGDDGRPRPSAHAITLWQRSLMKRLEGARRQVAAGQTAGGTVIVAFVIGGRGELVSERVAKSSGSQALDAEAMLLVRRAVPFPTPPAGSREGDLSFTVPVRFK